MSRAAVPSLLLISDPEQQMRCRKKKLVSNCLDLLVFTAWFSKQLHNPCASTGGWWVGGTTAGIRGRRKAGPLLSAAVLVPPAFNSPA